jgi:uncharacterized pyridoxamine 5'-phosphate oxidase family protein
MYLTVDAQFTAPGPSYLSSRFPSEPLGHRVQDVEACRPASKPRVRLAGHRVHEIQFLWIVPNQNKQKYRPLCRKKKKGKSPLCKYKKQNSSYRAQKNTW